MWQIGIFEDQQLLHSVDVEGPVEMGRQQKGEPSPFEKRALSPGAPACGSRIVIAAEDGERTISRRHLRLEAGPNGSLLVKNLGKSAIGIENDDPVGPSESRETGLPARLILGCKVVRVQALGAPEEPPGSLKSLSDTTAPPTAESSSPQRFPGLAGGSEMTDKRLLQWLKTAMGVFQAAAGDDQFFQRAAQAVVDIIGLDTGRVLLWEDNGWQQRALAAASPRIAQADRDPSMRILNKVRQEKRTFWDLPTADLTSSQIGLDAVVAAPVLLPNGEVRGAVYGDRCSAEFHRQATITELEAMLVELIASGVAAGMARADQERAAANMRVRFEQFFTPELAQQLTGHLDLLRGRDVEVTLLFCDIRGFSRITERLGPGKTVEWIGDAMETLSDCVRAHAGVLVDYIGDELMAMWGAPTVQPDHARLACRAAADMLAAIPALNARWSATIQERMAVGIGVNSGVARVGNVGSQHKFKYGPLGNTVNLASRVQGATKYLRSPILVTGSTRQLVADEFPVRRLCRVRVVNIAEPVELYELAAPNLSDWTRLKGTYEDGLAAFERGEFRIAAQRIAGLLNEWPDDGPSVLLLSRAADSLLKSAPNWDPVWELPGK